MFKLPQHPFALVAILSLLVFPVLSGPTGGAISSRATTCNGYSELCERGYGNVTFVGAHNSYAVGPVSNLLVNQDQNVTQQLNDGIRMLQMQAHSNNGVITLCHTSCGLFNGGTLEDYLKQVRTWLDSNPNEVLTLLIVNIDNLKATEYDAVFKSAGLDTLSYAPDSSPLTASAWPTLGSLIDQKRRLLTFLDNGADPTSVPYLLDEFTNVWETEFDVTDIARFDCSVNRTKGDVTTQMFLINHFRDQLIANLPAPFPQKANETNAVSGDGSLGAHVATCQNNLGRPPNFLLVDFYEFGGGSVFQVAAQVNGVQFNPKSIASPAPTTSGSNPTATNSARSIAHMWSINRLFPSGVLICGLVIGALAVSS
ncbi:PLC-like phosphodiesterase [Marasmius fiardii PR-910]|nr:PLC-like phosphodiesterase [Marasmius fiardii PR-910]